MEDLPIEVIHVIAKSSLYGWKLCIILVREFGLWSTTEEGQETFERTFIAHTEIDRCYEQRISGKLCNYGEGWAVSILEADPECSDDVTHVISCVNNLLHCENGPAIDPLYGGLSVWAKNGVVGRVKNPAIIMEHKTGKYMRRASIWVRNNTIVGRGKGPSICIASYQVDFPGSTTEVRYYFKKGRFVQKTKKEDIEGDTYINKCDESVITESSTTKEILIEISRQVAPASVEFFNDPRFLKYIVQCAPGFCPENE